LEGCVNRWPRKVGNSILWLNCFSTPTSYTLCVYVAIDGLVNLAHRPFELLTWLIHINEIESLLHSQWDRLGFILVLTLPSPLHRIAYLFHIYALWRSPCLSAAHTAYAWYEQRLIGEFKIGAEKAFRPTRKLNASIAFSLLYIETSDSKFAQNETHSNLLCGWQRNGYLRVFVAIFAVHIKMMKFIETIWQPLTFMSHKWWSPIDGKGSRPRQTDAESRFGRRP